MSPLTISILVFLGTVALFFYGKIALGLIGLTASVILQLTGVLPASTVWGNFTNSSVVIFASLFVLSAGLMKTQMMNNFIQTLSNLKGNSRKILWLCILISTVMSILTNSTATMSAMIPVILGICERSGVNARKILKPACDTANLWTASMPVGMGVTMYATMNSMLTEMGCEVQMGIMDSAIMKTPVLLGTTVFYLFFSAKFLPDEPLKNPIALQESSTTQAKLSPVKEKLAYGLFFAVVACMLAAGILRWSLPTYIYPVVGAIILVFSGVLDAKEAIKAIPLDIMLLVGGMLNIGAALGNSGGAEVIGNAVSGLLQGSTNIYLVLGVLFMIPAICTQFMNNIAVINGFLPICIATCVSVGIDPRLGAMAALFAGTASLLTPMASAPQAMIMGPGEYSVKDYFVASILPFILHLVILMIWAPIAAKLLWGM